MEWHWNYRMMEEWEVSRNPVFSSPKKHLHSSSFRHSFVISKCLEWQEMKITMERYHSSVILLTSTSFRHSRMMMEWPNEGKWRDIFEPRQNPWFWNSLHSTVIPSFLCHFNVIIVIFKSFRHSYVIPFWIQFQIHTPSTLYSLRSKKFNRVLSP